MAEVASISLDTSAMQAYARLLKQAPKIAREEMTAGLMEALTLLEREVKDSTPTRAGTLRQSVTRELMGEPVSIGAGVAGKVFSSLNYAIPVELGTKPHDIVAKRGRALSFVWGGNQVAFKRVRHPGTKGAFMFTRTMEKQAGQVNEILARAVQRIAARLEGGA